jgi:hypothetical protein
MMTLPFGFSFLSFSARSFRFAPTEDMTPTTCPETWGKLTYAV